MTMTQGTTAIHPAQSVSPTDATPVVRVGLMSRLPRWLTWRYLAFMWAALLAYGTLIPLRIDTTRLTQHQGDLFALVVAFFTSPQWIMPTAHSFTPSASTLAVDLLVNIALYGPLGLFIRLGCRRHHLRWLQQIAVSFICLFTLSYLLECTQSLMLDRVPSYYDVLTNTLGGLLFALSAAKLRLTFRMAAFGLYRRFAYLIHSVQNVAGRLRDHPAALFTILAVDAALVAVWLLTVAMSEGTGTPTHDSGTHWLPFLSLFYLPYDQAFLRIGQSMTIYCLLAMLISIQLLGIAKRRRMGILVLTIALLAATRQAVTMLAAQKEGKAIIFADITEPIIALMAVGFLAVLAAMFFHAVRCSNRRQQQAPIRNDRRRYAYRY